MPRNNIKILTDGQLDELNKKYIFSLSDDKIYVTIKDYNRITCHDVNESFFINSDIRKITINPISITYYRQFKEEKLPYSLFDIQQAVNILSITYQEVNKKNIINVINSFKKRMEEMLNEED